VIQLTLTLKMTTAQVVETSVTVNNNSPIKATFTRTIKLNVLLKKWYVTNNNFPRASSNFVHFFAVVAPLRHETSYFHDSTSWSRWTQHKNCPFHFQTYGPKEKLGDLLVLHCASLSTHNKMAAVKKSISVTLLKWSLLKRKATGIFACGRFLPRWDSMCWECA